MITIDERARENLKQKETEMENEPTDQEIQEWVDWIENWEPNGDKRAFGEPDPDIMHLLGKLTFIGYEVDYSGHLSSEEIVRSILAEHKDDDLILEPPGERRDSLVETAIQMLWAELGGKEKWPQRGSYHTIIPLAEAATRILRRWEWRPIDEKYASDCMVDWKNYAWAEAIEEHYEGDYRKLADIHEAIELWGTLQDRIAGNTE